MQSGVFPSIGQGAEYEALYEPCKECTGPACEKCKGTGQVSRRWKTSRLTQKVQARIWEWVKPRLPDYFAPIERVIDKLDPQKARYLLREAADDTAAMNNIFCTQAQSLLGTMEGVIVEFTELLRENHPEITHEIAGQILEDLGRREVQSLCDQYNAEHPDQPPIELTEMRSMLSMDDEERAKYIAARIKRKAEGEWPEAPKDQAPGA